MGCYIHGFLEIFEGKWIAKKEIQNIQRYDVFAILAGVRNYVNAIPISKPKGLPDDISIITKYKYIKHWAGYSHSESYLTWEEIEKYDKKQVFKDSRISCINKKTDEFMGKSSMTKVYDEKIGGYVTVKDGDEIGDYLYKCLTITPEEIIKNSDWSLFFDEMETLSKIYGKNHVRIVFWFDN